MSIKPSIPKVIIHPNPTPIKGAKNIINRFEDLKLIKPSNIIGAKGKKTFHLNTNNTRKEMNPIQPIVRFEITRKRTSLSFTVSASDIVCKTLGNVAGELELAEEIMLSLLEIFDSNVK